MRERPPAIASDQGGFLEEVYVRLELKDCSEGYRQERWECSGSLGFWVIESLSHCSAVCLRRVTQVLRASDPYKMDVIITASWDGYENKAFKISGPLEQGFLNSKHH